MNEEFLVNASHQLALITSLPFVHTARRSYRLDVLMSYLEAKLGAGQTVTASQNFANPNI